MKGEKRNYLGFINRNSSPYISDLGWSDGWWGKADDSFLIVKQLYGHVSEEELIQILSSYLRGYLVGLDMNENYEEYYDEDGNIKEEYDGNMDSISDYLEDSVDRIEKYKYSLIKK